MRTFNTRQYQPVIIYKDLFRGDPKKKKTTRRNGRMYLQIRLLLDIGERARSRSRYLRAMTLTKPPSSPHPRIGRKKQCERPYLQRLN